MKSVVWTVVFTALFSATQFTAFQFMMVAYFAGIAASFLMSCDSLPPEEKARLRVKREMKKHASAMTSG